MKKLVMTGIALACSIRAALAMDFFTISTGDTTGSAFPTATNICRAFNLGTTTSGLHCNVEPTKGAENIIDNLMTGRAEFGIVQGDVVYQAYHGIRQFQGKPYKKLRTVMAIYPTVLTLIVNQRAGIKTLADIRGKRINLGSPGSGTETTVMTLLEEMGLTKQDFEVAGNLEMIDCFPALANQSIDGFFTMVGHPSVVVYNKRTEIDVIPIEGEAVEKMMQDYPYYLKTVISIKPYPKLADLHQKDLPSLEVKAVLVASETASDNSIRWLIKTVLDNLGNFKKIHPLLRQPAVTAENFVKDLNVPLHPAAEQYYREVGLLK